MEPGESAARPRDDHRSRRGRRRGAELFLATDGGVLLWGTDGQSYTRYASEHGLPGNPVRRVVSDHTGTLWALGDGGELCYLDGDAFRRYEPLKGVVVRCLHAGAERLWAVGDHGAFGICRPDEPVCNRLPSPGRAARAMAGDGAAGGLWLCNARGVYRCAAPTGGGAAAAVWERRLDHPGVFAIAVVGDDLWLGTLQGLRRVSLGAGVATGAVTADATPAVPSWPAGEVTCLAAAPAYPGVLAAVDVAPGGATSRAAAPTRSPPSGTGRRASGSASTRASGRSRPTTC